MPKRKYPEKKDHELTESDKAHIRERATGDKGDTYALAQELGCSNSQVAGVKAAMHRSGTPTKRPPM